PGPRRRLLACIQRLRRTGRCLPMRSAAPAARSRTTTCSRSWSSTSSFRFSASSRARPEEGPMSEPFLGEIKIISWNFPPKGWTFCNGQLLPINQNQALFAILGTTYGGDGRQTFGLPNLQGRTPVHVGNGIVLGEMGGEISHALSVSELPAHNHVPVGTTSP